MIRKANISHYYFWNMSRESTSKNNDEKRDDEYNQTVKTSCTVTIKPINQAACNINSGYSSEMNMGIQNEQCEPSAAVLFTVRTQRTEALRRHIKKTKGNGGDGQGGLKLCLSSPCLSSVAPSISSHLISLLIQPWCRPCHGDRKIILGWNQQEKRSR